MLQLSHIEHEATDEGGHSLTNMRSVLHLPQCDTKLARRLCPRLRTRLLYQPQPAQANPAPAWSDRKRTNAEAVSC